MTDAALERKFLLNAEPAIGRHRSDQVLDTIMRLPHLSDVSELNRLCA